MQKVVEEYDESGESWSTVYERRFIWAGWLMLMELDGSNDAVRKYTWGLDCSGLLGGTGNRTATNTPPTERRLHPRVL